MRVCAVLAAAAAAAGVCLLSGLSSPSAVSGIGFISPGYTITFNDVDTGGANHVPLTGVYHNLLITAPNAPGGVAVVENADVNNPDFGNPQSAEANVARAKTFADANHGSFVTTQSSTLSFSSASGTPFRLEQLGVSASEIGDPNIQITAYAKDGSIAYQTVPTNFYFAMGQFLVNMAFTPGLEYNDQLITRFDVTSLVGTVFPFVEMIALADGDFAGQCNDYYYDGEGQRELPGNLPCPPPPNSGGNGDPQFTGFLGQSYQVHGVSGSMYNILSAPSLQYNALFSYLSSGSCRAGTQCFSHPGNYFGAVSLQLSESVAAMGSDDGQLVAATAGGGSVGDGYTPMAGSTRMRVLRIESGAVDVGLNATLDGAALETGVSVPIMLPEGEASVVLESAFVVSIRSPVFDLRVHNSDRFLNQDVAVSTALQSQIAAYKAAVRAGASADELAAQEARLPHGILGQTWRARTYANRWMHIEGTLQDYELADGITGTDFKYNRFAL